MDFTGLSLEQINNILDDDTVYDKYYGTGDTCLSYALSTLMMSCNYPFTDRDQYIQYLSRLRRINQHATDDPLHMIEFLKANSDIYHIALGNLTKVDLTKVTNYVLGHGYNVLRECLDQASLSAAHSSKSRSGLS